MGACQPGSQGSRRFAHHWYRASRVAPYRQPVARPSRPSGRPRFIALLRSEEHTSELQSLIRISYAVFCLQKKKIISSFLVTTSYDTANLTLLVIQSMSLASSYYVAV